ncbi:MAG TPA: hypothetical protein VFM54_10900 [Micromonosporaceae bacterium]|nr:hypothetical protein [Micromonosporaceae bacterium]
MRVWRYAAVGACAVGIGVAVTLSSRYRTSDLWPVWAALAVSLCGAAAVVWFYGLHRWRELSSAWQVKVGDAVWPTLAVVTGVLVSLLFGELASGSPGSAWRGDVLVTVAFLGGSSAAMAMFGVGAAAARLPAVGGRERRADLDGSAAWRTAVDLGALRRTLRGLATALGSLVALSTLALGASVLMTGAPRETVLVLGAGGSLVVGVCYSPAAVAIRRAGGQLVEEVFANAAPGSPGELVEQLEQRARLEQLVGVDRTLLGELQAAIPVAGPLLAGASILLPG